MKRAGFAKYILVGQTPVIETDLLKWAEWMADVPVVATTSVRGGIVSTVFLGLDHNHFGGRPLLFESMAFLDGESADCQRCSTWLEAERQHAAMVARYGGEAVENAGPHKTNSVRK